MPPKKRARSKSKPTVAATKNGTSAKLVAAKVPKPKVSKARSKSPAPRSKDSAKSTAHVDSANNPWVKVDPSGVAFNLGKGLAVLFGLPIYYSGYMNYCMLYPILWIISSILSVISALLYPFKLIYSLVIMVVMFIPNLMFTIAAYIARSLGQACANLIGFIVCCSIVLSMLGGLENFVANPVPLLTGILLLCAAVAFSTGVAAVFSFVLAVLMSPLYFVWNLFCGFQAGVLQSSKYWAAIRALNLNVSK
jgi:hypothetical protein